MKFIFLTGMLMVFAVCAHATDQYVHGYTKKNGTYVQGHYRTEPNDTVYDNYSTKGNTNPYNGKKGTVDPNESNNNNSWSNSYDRDSNSYDD